MQVGCPRSVCRCAEDMAPTQVCCSCNLQLPSVHVTRRTRLPRQMVIEVQSGAALTLHAP